MPYPYELEQLAREAGISPLVVLEEFLSRAAIREYDGGMTRDVAEARAYEDCVGHFAPSPPSLATLPRAESESPPRGDHLPAGESAPVDTSGENESLKTQTVNTWRAP